MLTRLPDSEEVNTNASHKISRPTLQKMELYIHSGEGWELRKGDLVLLLLLLLFVNVE